jgi:GDP-L-fucose synthase
MIRKMHDARLAGKSELVLWGTGTPLREFLYADDLAEGCLFLLKNYSAEGQVNIGAGSDLSIRELAGIVAEAVGYAGTIRFDASKPDGTPRKLMDSSRIMSMGWSPRTSLREGVRKTYEWFLANHEIARL